MLFQISVSYSGKIVNHIHTHTHSHTQTQTHTHTDTPADTHTHTDHARHCSTEGCRIERGGGGKRREKRMEGIEGIMRGKTTMKAFSKHSCITTIKTFLGG